MTEFKEDVLLGALMMSLGRGDAGVFSGLGTSRGQTCGKVFKRHELVYRCKCVYGAISFDPADL